jgi:glucose 1-dehydrogenase
MPPIRSTGAALVVNFRSDAEEANRVVEAIRRSGADAIALQTDVSREDQFEAIFAEIKKNSARSIAPDAILFTRIFFGSV